MDLKSASRVASDRQIGFLFEALLARLPQILEEYGRTGKLAANRWGRVLTQDVRKLHLARKSRD